MASAAATGPSSRITIQEAAKEHIPSLSTIFARSFHPTNAFMRKTFPDTPPIRDWWAGLMAKQMADHPTGRILVAVDAGAPDPALSVVGFLLFRRFTPTCRGSGIFDIVEYTEHHDHDALAPAVNGMTEFRERLYLGKGGPDHLLVELFGVDATVKGGGVGSRLLRRVCEVADGEGMEVCVQANGSAKGFYEKVGGFEEKETMILDGGYAEYMMARKPRSA